EHMARGNEHMARGNELMDEIREEMRLSRAEHERSRRVHQDLRAFIQEQTRRMELAGRAQVEGLSELRRHVDRQVGAIDDMRDQIRANTEAVLRRLDRYPPNGGTAPA
ncbi:MAG: hypothetical protein ACRDKV_05050, partial [Solirubrobacterales bacterium]